MPTTRESALPIFADDSIAQTGQLEANLFVLLPE